MRLGRCSGVLFTGPGFLSRVQSFGVVATTKLVFFPLVQESIDESFIREAILSRLGDDSIDVVLSAVSAFKVSDCVHQPAHVLVNISLPFSLGSPL